MEHFRVESREEDGRGSLPQRIGFCGVMQDVVELLDQWQGEDHRYFRVRTADHACFLVRFDESDRRWSLVSFEAGREKSSGKRSL